MGRHRLRDTNGIRASYGDGAVRASSAVSAGPRREENAEILAADGAVAVDVRGAGAAESGQEQAEVGAVHEPVAVEIGGAWRRELDVALEERVASAPEDRQFALSHGAE